MRFVNMLAAAAAAQLAAGLGFASYREIRTGFDNTDEIEYYETPRQAVLFLYLQIIAGTDHTKLINDFKTLAKNYGSKGVPVIPRVRYGNTKGDFIAEPKNATLIMEDVKIWTKVFTDIQSTIEVPVIQAGFLGLWGEWHSGPFCPEHGNEDSAANRKIKKDIVEELRKAGPKIALRYPLDHDALGYKTDAQITGHDDCIFDGGPLGEDGGTFPDDDISTWRQYVKDHISGNTFGGEGCDQAGGTYNWSNFDDVCGDNGLIKYIKDYKIAYLNVSDKRDTQIEFGNSFANYCTHSPETPKDCRSCLTARSTKAALTRWRRR